MFREDYFLTLVVYTVGLNKLLLINGMIIKAVIYDYSCCFYLILELVDWSEAFTVDVPNCQK